MFGDDRYRAVLIIIDDSRSGRLSRNPSRFFNRVFTPFSNCEPNSFYAGVTFRRSEKGALTLLSPQGIRSRISPQARWRSVSNQLL
jgi:hypothetical protein